MSHHDHSPPLGEHQSVPPDTRQSRQRLVEFLWSSRNAYTPATDAATATAARHAQTRMQHAFQPGGSAQYYQENEPSLQSHEYFNSDDDATLASIAQNRHSPTWTSRARAAELKALQGHYEPETGPFAALHASLNDMPNARRRQQWKPLDLSQLAGAESDAVQDSHGKFGRECTVTNKGSLTEAEVKDDANPNTNTLTSREPAKTHPKSQQSEASCDPHFQQNNIKRTQHTSSGQSEGSERQQSFTLTPPPSAAGVTAVTAATPAAAAAAVQHHSDKADPAAATQLPEKNIGQTQRQAVKPPSHYPAVKGTTGDRRYNQYRAATGSQPVNVPSSDLEQLSFGGSMTRLNNAPAGATPMNPQASVFHFTGTSNRPGSSGTYASIAAAAQSPEAPPVLQTDQQGEFESTRFAAAPESSFGVDQQVGRGASVQVARDRSGSNVQGVQRANVTNRALDRPAQATATPTALPTLPIPVTHHSRAQTSDHIQSIEYHSNTQSAQTGLERTAHVQPDPEPRVVVANSYFGPITQRALDVVRGYPLPPVEAAIEREKIQKRGQAYSHVKGAGLHDERYAHRYGHDPDSEQEHIHAYETSLGAPRAPRRFSGLRPGPAWTRPSVEVNTTPVRSYPATLYGYGQGPFHSRHDERPRFAGNDAGDYMRPPPGLLTEDLELPTGQNRHDQMWYYCDNRFSSETAQEITDLWNDAKQKAAASKESESFSSNRQKRTAAATDSSSSVVREKSAGSEQIVHGAAATGRGAGAGSGGNSSSEARELTDEEKRERETALDVVEDLILPVLANLREYMTGPGDYFTQNWATPPEWCIDRSPAGLNSAFGDTWGTPPARVGRDPRYRSVQSEGRTPPIFNPSSSASTPLPAITPLAPRQQLQQSQQSQQQYRSQPNRQQQHHQHSSGRAWQSEESPSRQNWPRSNEQSQRRFR